MGKVTNIFVVVVPKTADGGCSHESKRCLVLGRKTMTNLHSILKSGDITLLTKVFLEESGVLRN